MLAYLEGDLWLSLARDANRMAARMAESLRAISGVSLLHPVDANILFVNLPRAAHERAQTAGAAYYPMADLSDTEATPARLVCSWSTTEADVDAFLALIRG